MGFSASPYICLSATTYIQHELVCYNLYTKTCPCLLELIYHNICFACLLQLICHNMCLSASLYKPHHVFVCLTLYTTTCACLLQLIYHGMFSSASHYMPQYLRVCLTTCACLPRLIYHNMYLSASSFILGLVLLYLFIACSCVSHFIYYGLFLCTSSYITQVVLSGSFKSENNDVRKYHNHHILSRSSNIQGFVRSNVKTGSDCFHNVFLLKEYCVYS